MARASLLLTLALLAVPALAGCINPSGVDTAETNPTPGDTAADLPLLPDVISALEPAGSVEIGGANDLVFRDHYAFVSAGSGTYVVDISDPANPVQVSFVDCKGKDIGVVDLPIGRRILTVSFQADDACPDAAPSGGIRLVDVTRPEAPLVLGQVPLRFGSHTNTPYGDTGIVYNSAYDLTNPLNHHRSEIVDITNPEEPKVADEFMFPLTSTSPGCHDILAEPELNRVVCAGITETMIWDTTDPLAPKVTDTLVNPLINIHHSAATARNGTLLILGDEFAGALGPGCNGPAPTGAVWFYQIDGHSVADQFEGYLPPPAMPGTTPCTAHNFNVIEGHDLLVSAFYHQGSILIDFSDASAPKILDHETPTGTIAWATYYYNGAVYTGDTARGLDVFTLA